MSTRESWSSLLGVVVGWLVSSGLCDLVSLETQIHTINHRCHSCLRLGDGAKCSQTESHREHHSGNQWQGTLFPLVFVSIETHLNSTPTSVLEKKTCPPHLKPGDCPPTQTFILWPAAAIKTDLQVWWIFYWFIDVIGSFLRAAQSDSCFLTFKQEVKSD